MGALGRADCNCGEIQVGDGMGGDGDGDMSILPVGIRAVYKGAGPNKTKANHKKPCQFSPFSL